MVSSSGKGFDLRMILCSRQGETRSFCSAFPKFAFDGSMARTSNSNSPPLETVSCPSKVLIFPVYRKGISCKTLPPFVSRATTRILSVSHSPPGWKGHPQSMWTVALTGSPDPAAGWTFGSGESKRTVKPWISRITPSSRTS